MRDLIKDTPLVKESRERSKKSKEEEKVKKPSGGIRTHNLQSLKSLLYRRATTVSVKIGANEWT